MTRLRDPITREDRARARARIKTEIGVLPNEEKNPVLRKILKQMVRAAALIECVRRRPEFAQNRSAALEDHGTE